MKNIKDCRVLIVDDDIDGANAVCMMLGDWGFEAHKLYSADRLVEEIKEFKPHILLLDIRLGDDDGYNIARTLRQNKDLRHLEIVAFTGQDLPAIMQTDFTSADYHFLKSTNLHELEKLLKVIATDLPDEEQKKNS